MTVVGRPSTVLIDPPNGHDQDTTSIVATVIASTGVPQKGLTVIFSNTGGVLTSGTAGVKTDAGGIATDTLTVRASDPAEITITATSGSLTQTVKVTKTTVATNRPPVATIVATPHDQQVSARSVVFDGSGSNDPHAGDSITMYKWVITSTNHDADKPANPLIAEGPGVSGVSFPSDLNGPFTNIQDLTVTLLVTVDRTAPTTLAAGWPGAYRAPGAIPS